MQVFTFSIFDYLLFGLMLLSSALVGVYHGCFKKQDTAQEYLLGGKRMSMWPIAMSVVSSTLSGFTLLSVPADVYRYGITYIFVVPNMITVGFASYYLFLPVFHKLQITSVYEYLEIRFNRKVRLLGSMMYAIHMVLFLPIVIYIPALALGQVTTLDIHLITLIVCIVCIFYTTIGGIKAVVWSDAIQFFIMLGSLVVVIGVGIWREGGLRTIFRNAYEGERLHVDFDLNYVKRETFWAVGVGQAAQLVAYFSCGQGSVQKFLSLPSFKTIKIALIWSQIGIALIVSLSVFCGILMYTKYMDCDPLIANLIQTSDQILPMYVMDLVNFLPGVCGLFISGIFSAGLSTLSAILNCLAATIYEDFVSPFVSKDISPKRVSQYLKWIVVIIGIESTAMVYVVKHLGGLVNLSLSFAGITNGPILGLFCVGALLPQVTSKGALSGGVVSVCTMAWIIMTAQWYKVKGYLNHPTLPLSTTGCNGSINSTFIEINSTVSSNITNFEPYVLFRVSFYWYAAMGLVITIIVALAVSCFTKEDKPLNKDCISPVMRFLIVDNNSKPPRYSDVALEKLNPQR